MFVLYMRIEKNIVKCLGVSTDKENLEARIEYIKTRNAYINLEMEVEFFIEKVPLVDNDGVSYNITKYPSKEIGINSHALYRSILKDFEDKVSEEDVLYIVGRVVDEVLKLKL